MKLTLPTLIVLPASRSVNVTAAFSFIFLVTEPKLVVADADAVTVKTPALSSAADAQPDVMVPENVPLVPVVDEVVSFVENSSANCVPVTV